MKLTNYIQFLLFVVFGLHLLGCKDQFVEVDSDYVYIISNDSDYIHLEYIHPSFLNYKNNIHHSSCMSSFDRDEILISNISDTSLIKNNTGEFGPIQPFLTHQCDSNFAHEYVIIGKNLHYVDDMSQPVIYNVNEVRKILLETKDGEHISNVEVVKLNNNFNLILWDSYYKASCMKSTHGIIGDSKYLFQIEYSQINSFDNDQIEIVKETFKAAKVF